MRQLIQSILLLSLNIPLSSWACRCKEPDLRSIYANADAVAMVKINEVATLAKEIVRAKGGSPSSVKI